MNNKDLMIDILTINYKGGNIIALGVPVKSF